MGDMHNKITLTCVAAALAALTALADKGTLVLQVGSDWCVSGQDVRKAFESAEFRRAVGSRFELLVYDEMDFPDEKTKVSNERVKDKVVRTKRFPAITCLTPTPAKLFAQLENIPASVTVDGLAEMVAKAAKRKDAAEKLFKDAASMRTRKPEGAADAYGKAFELLTRQAGEFNAKFVREGNFAYADEWRALCELDSGDRYGWTRRFTMDEHACVSMVEKVTAERSQGTSALLEEIRRVPQGHLTANQRQCIKVMEYAATADGTDKPLKSAEKKLLREAVELGRDTFWGQFAAGRLIMDGDSIDTKELYRAPARSRPSGSTGGVRQSFPLEQAKNAIDNIKPGAKLTDQQKLAIARHAVLRLIGQRGWDELAARPGGGQFVKAFMNDRTWLEDFAWSGTFPADSNNGWARSESGPGDGAAAALALESLVFQDDGRWVPFENGRFADNEGRRFMTALAIVYSDKDEAWLADVLDAYRTTAKEGRLHRRAYSQPVWQWRFAVHQGHGTGSTDNMAAQQRHLDKFVNLPMREYGGTCWMIEYRMKNCFGDSVQGPLYYKPWETTGEWPKRRYSQIVGGVCGELSKFGSATSNAHGLPSTTVGQPGHCAYSRRLADGSWEVDYSVTGHSQMHMCFWNRHPWQYTSALEGTFEGDREQRLNADRMIELALLAEKRGAKHREIELFYQYACRSWRSHYGAWHAYGEWVARSSVPLANARTWVRGCAKGMRTGRQPVWDFLTPYFGRVAAEGGAKALADALVEFAPLLRQDDGKIQEEADFKTALDEWTKPIAGNRDLVATVLKAMLGAQYGTRDYFSQTLGWGGDILMADGKGTKTFMDVLDAVVAEKSAGGKRAKLDFAPLILAASKAGNLSAFRQLAQLQDRLEPVQKSGKAYPASDFGGPLLSAEGMLRTSSTTSWDVPSRYTRCMDATPSAGNSFHTDKEKAPWATVVLPGPSDVCGIVVANDGGAQNRERQVPLEVQVSEDGESWATVFSAGDVRETYRVDLRSAPRRARQVRVRRTPDAKEDFFHLGKILVYGRKLY